MLSLDEASNSVHLSPLARSELLFIQGKFSSFRAPSGMFSLSEASNSVHSSPLVRSVPLVVSLSSSPHEHVSCAFSHWSFSPLPLAGSSRALHARKTEVRKCLRDCRICLGMLQGAKDEHRKLTVFFHLQRSRSLGGM